MSIFLKTVKLVGTAGLAVAIGGCGGGSGGGSGGTTVQTVYGTAQLGNLSNANVKIYEVNNDGSTKLKWIETTSKNDILDKIGKFNAHTHALASDKYYLYQVSGGDDWDVDDDGVKDAKATKNKGTIRAIALGSDIVKAGNAFRVTAISEVLYEHVAKSLKYHFNPTTFGTQMDQTANDIINSGTNGDIVTFDPVNDKDLLIGPYIDMEGIIHDIHQGLSPFLSISSIIGHIQTPADATDVKLANDGRYAFVTYADTSKSGMEVVEISDPTSPVNMNILNIPGSAVGIAVSADSSHAYVASVEKGLQILNTTATDFNIAGMFDTDGWAASATLSKDGTKAYVADGGNGMEIVNVNLPYDPIGWGHIDTAGFARHIALSPDTAKAYIADESAGLQIVDISNQFNLTILGNLPTAGKAWSVTVSSDGSKAYVADGKSGLLVVDVNDPSHPVLKGSLDTSGFSYDVVLSSDGTKAYVADGESGLQIVDISDPQHPALVGHINMDGTAYSVAVSPDNTKVYIADGKGGLQIIDVTILDPEQ